MAILETNYKENMSKDEAIRLCVAAIEAGIYHDLGSGSNVDVAVITKDKVEMHRNLKHDNKKMFSKPDGYQFRKDNVKVLQEFRHKLIIEEGEQPMELV